MANCCHNSKETRIEMPPGARRIVLAGNPNVGKSVIFNYLTGMYVDVSNYPGTTLEISHGHYEGNLVIDTPGVYGISSFNDEERVARDVILSADVVVNVVNAMYLERDLFLTLQIIDTGVPTVVVLNMVDEAEQNGLKIDYEKLSQLLGVRIIPTVAIKKQNLDQLKSAIYEALPGHVDKKIAEKILTLSDQVKNKGEALLILEGDKNIAKKYNMQPGTEQEEIYLHRRQKVDSIINQIVQDTKQNSALSLFINRLMIRPCTGIPLFLLALYIMYKTIGVFVAGTVVGFTEETVMVGIYEPFARHLVSQIINLNSVLGTILAGEFGLLTMTVTYVLGLLMPLVVGFYFFLSLFEDSGYLPRIAALSDRALTGIGLNGRAIIPLILGFGCVTVATITTRLLGSEREKRIAVFLLGLTIPCSAQLGVIAGMLAKIAPQFIILYISVILTVLVATGTILHILLPGNTSDLLIDLPPLRLPSLKNVLTKTWTKSYQFLLEAFPLFALGALLISVLQLTGVLASLQNLLSPLTMNWLHLPKESANAFIMGIVRRDFGAAGLANMQLTSLQVIVALITITLFVPCIASILVIFKERSKKEALLMWLGTWVIAFTVGGIVAQLAHLIGTTTPWQILAIAAAVWTIALVLILVLKYFKKQASPFITIEN
ncbi:ferrous iron transport protein B [Bacillota bacterium LX-D]|nr:ferrous iron transport protein B [Bacillota bacterium LX-D]